MPEQVSSSTFDDTEVDNGKKLPSVADYCFAAANTLVPSSGTRSRLELQETRSDLVAGPLLLRSPMGREEWHRYMELWAGDCFNRLDRTKLLGDGVHSLQRLGFPSVYDPTSNVRRLTLDLDSLPRPTPEMVQRIVRLASLRWFLNFHENEILSFAEEIADQCGLNDIEKDFLEKLLLRCGTPLSLTDRDSGKRRESRLVIRSLHGKLQEFFNPDGKPNQKYIRSMSGDGRYFADSALLRKLPDPLPSLLFGTEELHNAYFGDYLPIPGLLLHDRFDLPPAENPKMNIRRIETRIRALEASFDHIQELVEEGMEGMQYLLDQLSREIDQSSSPGSIEVIRIHPSGKPSAPVPKNQRGYFLGTSPCLVHQGEPKQAPGFPPRPVVFSEPEPTGVQVTSLEARRGSGGGHVRLVRPGGQF